MDYVVHLITQRGQPYGSVRQCCEVCGKALSAIRDDRTQAYVTSQFKYDELVLKTKEDTYTRCRDVGRKSSDATT